METQRFVYKNEKMLHIPGLFIAESEGRGRGVFTAVDIDKGDIIEYAPVIIIPPKQLTNINKTVFYDYYFNWPQPEGAACVALGYGSIYNHSLKPNAEIVLDIDNNILEFHCLKETSAGSEILIDYTGGEKEASKKLWFKTV